MGATSVTGVGHGSVEGMDSGRKEYTVAASRLIGPRIVAAGTVGLASTGVIFINLPLLPTTPNEFLKNVPPSPTYPAGSYGLETYAVIVTDNGVISGGTVGTVGVVVGGVTPSAPLTGGTLAAGTVTAGQGTLSTGTDSSSNQFTQLALSGTTLHQYSYIIVKQGLMP